MRRVAIDLRPIGAEDLDAVCALIVRSEAHDRVLRAMEVSELNEELDDVRVVRATDTRAAYVGDALAGYVYTRHLPSDTGATRGYVHRTVDPAHRGLGVGRALLAWGVGRAEDRRGW